MACSPQTAVCNQISALMGTVPIMLPESGSPGINVHSADFKAWFGDSQIKDKSGNPMLVFHGSPDRDIRSFDRRGSIGTFFTSSAKLAASYTGSAGSVYPVYLSIQKPLRWDYAETDRFQEWLLQRLINDVETPWEIVEDYDAYVQQRGFEDCMPLGDEGLQQAVDEILKFPPGQVDCKELDPLGGFIRLYATERGYDGMVRIYDIGEGYHSDLDEYIPFEPEQIRLAVGG